MSIVITGNPGVGKHTISDEIAKRFELEIIDINSVAKEEGLFEKNIDSNDVDVEKLKKILAAKVSEKNLIVGHLAPYVLDKNQLEKIIILRRDPYDLMNTYRDRKYTEKKCKENAGSEILGIIAHDSISKFKEKSFQVNTSEKSIQEVIERVANIISNSAKSEDVDWLELVTKNNDLKKFFDDLLNNPFKFE